MKIVVKSSQDTAEKLGARWNLSEIHHVADTRRAVIYKALQAGRPVALKLYKQIGASGEGAANTFLKQLAPGIGPQIYHLNALRTAVLMDWLEGPRLDTLVNAGDGGQAVVHLAEMAKAVAHTDFKPQFIYQRVTPKLQQDFKRHLTTDQSSSIERAAILLDQLAASSPKEQVVHGDLWFGNVILTEDGPRLFDPKGLRADPAYEFGKALAPAHRDLSVDDYLTCIKDRASVMAAAIDTPPERVIQWGAVAQVRSVFKYAPETPQRQTIGPYLDALLDLAQRA